LNKSARFQDSSLFEYTSDPFGLPELREAIAGYLIRSRSVKCTPDQIAVFSGAQSAIDLIGRMLLDAGDTAAVENPGFPGARRSFMTHDVKVVPIPVDGHGLQVEILNQRTDKIKLVYVTPSHQDPTGTVMSLPRRLELLKWAERTGGLIVEDDFDSEYRYGEKPVPALQGLDDGDNVIYLSSFWKVLFPVVRMGFIVLPRRLMAPMRRAKSLIERDFPLLEQRALTDFINEGHLERHIRRTRAMYAKRRAALVQAVTRLFRKRVTISDASAGMHLIVTFSPELDDAQITRASRAAHVPMVSTSNHYMSDPPAREYMIGFAHGNELQITSAIERFAQELIHDEQRTEQVPSASY
jgi:GntR family transcriptional regulator/MocR family aminotransferase